MTIKEAVKKAKEVYVWHNKENQVTVAVEFSDIDGLKHETTYDLYEEDKVGELEEIWNDQYVEMESTLNGINYVEMHKYGWGITIKIVN